MKQQNLLDSICMALQMIKCDWIYGNRSKSHIGSYEIIDSKDFNTLQPAKHTNEIYPEGKPFHCV